MEEIKIVKLNGSTSIISKLSNYYFRKHFRHLKGEVYIFPEGRRKYVKKRINK